MFNIDIARDGYATQKPTEDGPVEVWVDFYAIVATNERGARWVLADGSNEDLAAVEALLKTVLAVGDNPDTQPDKWYATDPLYGSDAWDSEAEYSLACFEADAYGEPRPRWF